MKRKLAALGVALFLTGCGSQVAVGSNIDQTMNVTRSVISHDTVGIIAFAVVGGLLILMVIVGLGASGGRPQ